MQRWAKPQSAEGIGHRVNETKKQTLLRKQIRHEKNRSAITNVFFVHRFLSYGRCFMLFAIFR